MSVTTPEAPERAPEVRLIDEARGALDDLKRLAVLEFDLARSEAGVAFKRVLITVLFLVGALLFLYAAFIYGIATIAEVLGAFDHWYGLLITVGVLLVIAAVLTLLAYRTAMKAKTEAMSTITSIKGDVEWLRQLATRRSSES